MFPPIKSPEVSLLVTWRELQVLRQIIKMHLHCLRDVIPANIEETNTIKHFIEDGINIDNKVTEAISLFPHHDPKTNISG